MAKQTDKKTLVLLDAHAILHRAFHALPDFSSPSGEPTGALYGVVTMVLKIVEELKPDYIVACFDLPEPTYRHDAFDGYKAKREKTDDTLVTQIDRSRDIFAAFGIPIYEHPGFEADDVLGTIALQVKGEKGLSVIIASGDMDTLQCVDKKRVQVYTLRKGIKDTVMYDEKAVKERFGFPPSLVVDYKGLRGDASDNIPGIAGIGEKTATELITNFGSIEKIYKTLEQKDGEKKFQAAGIKPRIVKLLKEQKEEAEFSKMLATIRTDTPITFELPQKYWKEAADVEAVLTLFSDLGFRTLAARIKQDFDVDEEVSMDQISSGVSDADVAKTAVMIWLLQSDRTNPSYDDIIDYGRSYFETTDFEEITKKLEEVLKKHKMYHIFEEIEEPLIEVLEYMHEVGVKLDTTYLKNLSKKLHKELSALEKDIYAHAGVEFNINSPKQMGDVLFDTLDLKPKNAKKTATGQRSTRESELEKMKDDHPIIPSILRYRELQKLLSTYIDNLPTMVGDDGRLHTTFIQTGAATGRMASQNPGLQNIPIRTEEGRAVRGGFVAEDGFTLVSIDYSQIELRIAAILSGDEKLVERDQPSAQLRRRHLRNIHRDGERGDAVLVGGAPAHHDGARFQDGIGRRKFDGRGRRRIGPYDHHAGGRGDDGRIRAVVDAEQDAVRPRRHVVRDPGPKLKCPVPLRNAGEQRVLVAGRRRIAVGVGKHVDESFAVVVERLERDVDRDPGRDVPLDLRLGNGERGRTVRGGSAGPPAA